MTAHKNVLLVGSVPLDNAEAVFRMLAARLGGDAKRYPDGETGVRINWLRWQRAVFENCAQMELVSASQALKGISDGLARPMYRIKDGVKPADVRFARLGYADAAIDSYKTFKKLRDDGVIPAGTRFQVSLPTAVAILTSFVVKEQRALVEPALEEVMGREVAQLVAAVPHRDLSIQWDVCMEVVGYEGGFELHYTDILKDSVAAISRQIAFVPKDVEVRIHLCYGDPGHKHIVEPKSAEVSVMFANAIAAEAGRTLGFIHIPVPKDRSDEPFFSPLTGLKVPPETEIYLGLVHMTDGVSGTKKRIGAAERYLGKFGVATECGFGRRPAETVPQLLEVHRQAGSA